MAFRRGIDGSEPVGRLGGTVEERGVARSACLAVDTLACRSCDAPVWSATGPLAPAGPLGCPFCDHAGAVRDFLSLAGPSRPARVAVRVVTRP